MEISHYCNSFISFKEGKSHLVCDPWIGEAEQTATVSFPIHEKGIKFLNNLKPDFIYISHLHCDHLDPKTLKGFNNKNIKILIKKFKIPILKKQIERLGFKNIFECESWKKYKLNSDISFAIIPQMASNKRGIEEQINFDLDTSIVIQSNKTKDVFYNGVDNPLTTKNYKTLKKYINKKFNKKIAITVLQDGAPGEYPPFFLNINREKAKKKLINESLNILKKNINILKPEVYFSSLPGAIISGKFSSLNKFAAKPTTQDVTDCLKKLKTKVINIDGGGSAIKNKNSDWKIKKSSNYFDRNKIIKKYSLKKYFYELDKSKINSSQIDDMFSKSCSTYLKKLKAFPINTSWNLEFMVYKNIFLNKNDQINFKASKFVKKYSIDYNKSKSKKNFSKLICHIDQKLFYGLLSKKYSNWNQPLSSLVLFERKPNKFDPNLLFSLNYLSV